jgi:hypothetical protein
MKLPSCTLLTRISDGSYVTVNVIVDNRDTFVIEIGTVYGPPPIRNVGGGDNKTCAAPNPCVVTGGAGGTVGAAAVGSCDGGGCAGGC